MLLLGLRAAEGLQVASAHPFASAGAPHSVEPKKRSSFNINVTSSQSCVTSMGNCWKGTTFRCWHPASQVRQYGTSTLHRGECTPVQCDLKRLLATCSTSVMSSLDERGGTTSFVCMCTRSGNFDSRSSEALASVLKANSAGESGPGSVQ